jgi:hypothetical protein
MPELVPKQLRSTIPFQLVGSDEAAQRAQFMVLKRVAIR